MSYKRSAIFEYLMSVLRCYQYENAGQYLTKLYKYSIGDHLDYGLLRKAASEDCGSYYYKSLVSFFEAYSSVRNGSYSWSTVKIYYAVFYACKSMLLANNYIFIRIGAFQKLNLRRGEKFSKANSQRHKNDHESAIYSVIDELPGEFILSNKIGDLSTLDWIKKKREQVNYIEIDFTEPEMPDYYVRIFEDIRKNGPEIISKYTTDEYLLFDEDYAILALPLRILIDTAKYIENNGSRFQIPDEKVEYILSLCDSQKLKRFVRENFIDPVIL